MHLSGNILPVFVLVVSALFSTSSMAENECPIVTMTVTSGGTDLGQTLNRKAWQNCTVTKIFITGKAVSIGTDASSLAVLAKTFAPLKNRLGENTKLFLNFGVFGGTREEISSRSAALQHVLGGPGRTLEIYGLKAEKPTTLKDLDEGVSLDTQEKAWAAVICLPMFASPFWGATGERHIFHDVRGVLCLASYALFHWQKPPTSHSKSFMSLVRKWVDESVLVAPALIGRGLDVRVQLWLLAVKFAGVALSIYRSLSLGFTLLNSLDGKLVCVNGKGAKMIDRWSRYYLDDEFNSTNSSDFCQEQLAK